MLKLFLQMDKLRVQPSNLDAERAVVGSILVDKDSLIKIADSLKPEFFYNDKLKLIYEVMLDLYEKRDPIDILTVSDRLKKQGNLDKIGGAGEITDLINQTPTTTNIEMYAKLVRDSYVRRSLITASSEIADLGYREATDIENILDLAEEKIFNISKENIKGEFTSIRKTLEESFDIIDDLYHNKDKMRGVPTGFPTLDQKLNGLRAGNLIIVAARPSVGKSSLIINIAQYAAVEHKIPTAIFSLEMSTIDLGIRMVSAQAKIDGFKITSGRLSDEELGSYGQAAGMLADAPIYIDDTPSISIMELRTKARRIMADKGIKMVVVDYLQLMRGRNVENRVQEVAEISLGLKALAKELNIPVIVAAQLNRAVEYLCTGLPQLSDLRESGSIEQDADVVMFLHRPDEENRNEILLVIAKHRNGPTGVIPMFFRGERTTFYEQTKREEG
ncbi:MAG: replicative DNA helicase [Niabella sp.]|nr:MAG: replicative DNA helicase [Niabella sp.]